MARPWSRREPRGSASPRRVEPREAPAELVLRLGEGGTIEGRVTRDDGSPAAHADVWARGRAETAGGPVRPDSRLGTIRVAAEGPTRFELRLPAE